MPKWNVDVYFSACKTVEVEADSWTDATIKGAEMVERPSKEDFRIGNIECNILEGEDEDE